MFSRTLPTLKLKQGFYKNDKSKTLSNPYRRWLYHYVIGGAVAGLGGYLALCYNAAWWEAQQRRDSGYYLCSTDMVDFLLYAPLNLVSNAFGRFSSNTDIPKVAHARMAKVLCWLYSIDTTDAAKDDFDSLQDFYVREWKPESRPISSAKIVSPCDGVVLSVDENVQGRSLVQVKGLTYGIRALTQIEPAPPPEGHKRVAVAIRLRLRDFHHVIAPAAFSCTESVYTPGALLPTTQAGFHWIPSVMTLNERLVVRGTLEEKHKPQLLLTMVGSTLTGKMTLSFDRRVHTNFLDPPEYAVFTPYKEAPALKKGGKVGTFHWGSSVVLLVDVPKEAQIVPSVGDEVKAGAPLMQY